jgi:hypothetical protein
LAIIIWIKPIFAPQILSRFDKAMTAMAIAQCGDDGLIN